MSFDINTHWNTEWQTHKDTVELTLQSLKEPFTQWVNIATESIQQGGKLLLFGNGGSAADAQHWAAELTARFIKDRDAIAAIALTTDTSALTAIGNDYGYEFLFSRQIEALGKSGDVAIGISTSGNSENVLKGLAQAKKQGLKTIGIAGRDGGQMPALCDTCLTVPIQTTRHVQEMHLVLGHLFCGALEQNLGLI